MEPLPATEAAEEEEAADAFDLDGSWDLNPRVALRPERFGALAYHFGTRRLSFLKSPRLVKVVESLGEAQSGRAACEAAGVTATELGAFRRALGVLAASGMILERNR
jgi:putative mycofactocin binding protein MftB